MTVMSGNVETRFWDAGNQFSLPDSSLYAPVHLHIAEAAAGKKGGRQCPAAIFSDQLVRSIDRGVYGPTRIGALAGTVRWMKNNNIGP